MLLPPPELVARYRTRAPRYTSYPTAPHFQELQPEAVLPYAGRGEGPLALYVHVPFCERLCTYCGCHVEIKRSRSHAEPYVDRLLAELDLWRAQWAPGRSLERLALGGGTPTFLTEDQLVRLIGGIRERVPTAPGHDFSIEIDPRTVDDSKLARLVELGFNRFSFGVQDFDERVLALVNRPTEAGTVEHCVRELRSHGDFALNLDLMYGLPGQTEESFARTVDTLIALRPSRVALFLYAHVPWLKPAQKTLEKRGLPDSDVKSALFSLATHKLTEAGYQAIGMDHFALPDDELVLARQAGTLQRNFMGYTTRAGLDLFGLGVSAIGGFDRVYTQDLKERPAWGERIDAGELPVFRGRVLTDEDLLRREVIMTLFCNLRVTLDATHFAAELEALAPMAEDGLVVLDGDTVQVTELGRHFIRNVCAVFDAYLEGDQGARRYSQTA